MAVICTPIFCKKKIEPIVHVNAFIYGVSEDTIELIEESLIFEVDSVKDLIKTLLRAFMMIININNFKIFNKTEMKVISSAKK